MADPAGWCIAVWDVWLQIFRACYPGHEGRRGNKLMKVGTIWFIDWLMVRVMCHG